MDSFKDSPLVSALGMAVPLWQLELKSVPFNELLKECPEISQMLAEKGDILLYGSKTKGETAQIFNRVARGLAILSFLPGGVKLFGQTWIAQHDQ